MQLLWLFTRSCEVLSLHALGRDKRADEVGERGLLNVQLSRNIKRIRKPRGAGSAAVAMFTRSLKNAWEKRKLHLLSAANPPKRNGGFKIFQDSRNLTHPCLCASYRRPP